MDLCYTAKTEKERRSRKLHRSEWNEKSAFGNA